MERDRFDFLRKLFQGNIRPQLEAYVNDSLRSPLLIEFDPTTACNFACPECISAGLLNKASIPSERIAGLMSEFARGGVKGIIFIGEASRSRTSACPRLFAMPTTSAWRSDSRRTAA